MIKTFMLNMDSETHEAIKRKVENLPITMNNYIIQAVQDQLKKD